MDRLQSDMVKPLYEKVITMASKWIRTHTFSVDVQDSKKSQDDGTLGHFSRVIIKRIGDEYKVLPNGNHTHAIRCVSYYLSGNFNVGHGDDTVSIYPLDGDLKVEQSTDSVVTISENKGE